MASMSKQALGALMVTETCARDGQKLTLFLSACAQVVQSMLGIAEHC